MNKFLIFLTAVLSMMLWNPCLAKAAGTVEVGFTREQVEAVLGKPGGVMHARDTTIMNYPGGKVKLKGGRVVSISPELIEAVEEARQMEAAGYVRFRDEWVTPRERYDIIDREKKERIAAAKKARNPQWTTDYQKALAEAKSSGKKVLLNFTGSDWCGWCIRLDKEVFSQPEFGQYAANHLILVKLDFPRKKKLPAALTRQNEQLAQQFGVRGFPTIYVVDQNGRTLHQSGYVKGGPRAFLATIR
jgi:protein disulfide-isomerase